jgi:hypothetical protein
MKAGRESYRAQPQGRQTRRFEQARQDNSCTSTSLSGMEIPRFCIWGAPETRPELCHDADLSSLHNNSSRGRPTSPLLPAAGLLQLRCYSMAHLDPPPPRLSTKGAATPREKTLRERRRAHIFSCLVACALLLLTSNITTNKFSSLGAAAAVYLRLSKGPSSFSEVIYTPEVN